MNIVSANRRHLDEIAAIENSTFSDPWSMETLRRELENPIALFLVCEKENGEVAGYISAETVVGEMYIGNLAVRQDCRRQGIGSLLLQEMVREAQKMRCEFVTLEVRVSNTPARNLYERFGFSCLGERRDYYAHPQENAAIYTRYLNEEET